MYKDRDVRYLHAGYPTITERAKESQSIKLISWWEGNHVHCEWRKQKRDDQRLKQKTSIQVNRWYGRNEGGESVSQSRCLVTSSIHQGHPVLNVLPVKVVKHRYPRHLLFLGLVGTPHGKVREDSDAFGMWGYFFLPLVFLIPLVIFFIDFVFLIFLVIRIFLALLLLLLAQRGPLV